MSEVTLEKIYDQIGLPELSELSTDEAARDFVPASFVGFADGDIAAIHLPYSDPTRARLYGAITYNEGEVAKRMLATALENGREPTPIYWFQELLASNYDRPNNAVRLDNAHSPAKIFPDAVVIDGNPVMLNRQPGLVVDYGACLNSRSIILDQLNFLQSDRTPFVYTPLTRLHFTNHVLMQTYDLEHGKGTANAMIDKRFYIGREDGVASATDEILRAQIEAGAEVEIADIIVCMGTAHTNGPEMRRGIENGYKMMKEGGILALRSFAKPGSEELGTDVMSEWAFEAGFQEESTLEYSRVSHVIGAFVLGKGDAEREIKTLILTK